MKIELCNFDNFDKILELIRQEYDAPVHLKPTDASQVKAPFFTIKDNDELVGISFFRKITDNLVRTNTTVIKKEYRNNGLGNRLNEKMEKYFKENGFKKISCNVYADNLPSIILKLKRGYLIEGTLLDHDFTGKHEYIMGKFL